MILRTTNYIKRKVRSFSVRFNTPINYYRFFPFNYLRYFKYGKLVPLRHVATYEVLLNLKKTLDQINVDFYLAQGTLLGAYRNNNIAGRPKDIDLWIQSDHLSKVFKNLNLLLKNGFRIVHLKVNKGIVQIQPPMGSPISFMSCEKNNDTSYRRSKLNESEIALIKGNPIISRKPRDENWDNLHYGMKMFFTNNSSTLLHGTRFLIPDNTLQFLEKKYGPNWRTPINTSI